MPNTPLLEARPAEAFQRIDERGVPVNPLRARRRDRRDCLGVWVLPVLLQDGLQLALPPIWAALAQRMPDEAVRQQGDIAECALVYNTLGWPAGAKALVLMLWPLVNRSFTDDADPAVVDLALAVAAAAAAAAEAGAAAMPNPAEVRAIENALADQGRLGGSLTSGLLHLPANPAPEPAAAAARYKGETSAEAASPQRQHPATAPTLLTFHLAACLYPGGLFERSARPHPGILDEPSNLPGPADRSLQRLRDLRSAQGFTTPVLLTGDQIYADATAGLFDPTLRDEPYKRAYDRLRDQDWRTEALALTTPMTLMDDHEVADNWEPSLNAGRAAEGLEPLYKGRYAFLQRQRHTNPDPIDGPRGRRSLWLADETTLPGHLLFVADTRSERTARDPAQMLEARILGEPQRKALLGALCSQQALRPGWLKFVATSSMLLPRRLTTAQAEQAHDDAVRAQPALPRHRHAGALRSDAWCGYPGSLQDLLASLADLQIHHCVFLSGDEHIGCVAEATVQRLSAEGDFIGDPVTLWSVHAGALYAPFPFANSVAEDFVEHETFSFEVNDQHYRCTVQAWFPSRGDGFVDVMVDVDPQNQAQEKLSLIFRHGQDPALDACWTPSMP